MPQALLQRIAAVQKARSVGPPPQAHFSTALQQAREWALLKAKEKGSTVSVTKRESNSRPAHPRR